VKLLLPQEAGTVAITGCSSGIGRALALELHARGYHVLATARRLESLSDLRARGIEIAALDVTDAAAIAALDLDRRGIGVLINNAGYAVMGPMLEVSPENLRRQLETNVQGVLALTQAVAPSMIRAGRGRIVNVSSVSGVMVTPFAGAYCASKAAVNALGDALRLELAPFGIDVITVQPGAISSSFGEAALATIDVDAVHAGPYAPVAAAVEARAVAQQRGAMPAERFATLMIDAVLRRKPPALVRIGPHSALLPAMQRWLPRTVREAYLSRRFQLSRLRAN